MQTARLVLRAPGPQDVEPHAEMSTDAEVQRFIGGPKRPYDAFLNLAAHAGHWQLRGYGGWAVERQADGAFLGRVGLWRPEGWPGLEVGWKLARPAWGSGYATEAARAVIGYAWTVVGATQLVSLIRADNEASARVAQRLGHVPGETVDVLGEPAVCHVLPRPEGDAPYAFRDAAPEDAPRIAAAVAEAMARYRDISPPGWQPAPLDVDDERTVQRHPHYRCVVAEPGGVLAGHVGWWPAISSRRGSHDPGLVHLRQLFVHPGWWGSGLAGRLHDVAVAAARTHGFRAMVLFTPLAQGRARRFYERRGWRLVAEHHHDELFGMGTVEYALDL